MEENFEATLDRAPPVWRAQVEDEFVTGIVFDLPGVDLPEELLGAPQDGLRYLDGALVDVRDRSVFYIDAQGRKWTLPGEDRQELACAWDAPLRRDAEGAWEAIPPPPRRVKKMLIIERLEAAGKAEAAIIALTQDPVALFKWNAALDIPADNPQLLAILAEIGADPAVILA